MKIADFDIDVDIERHPTHRGSRAETRLTVYRPCQVLTIQNLYKLKFFLNLYLTSNIFLETFRLKIQVEKLIFIKIKLYESSGRKPG